MGAGRTSLLALPTVEQWSRREVRTRLCSGEAGGEAGGQPAWDRVERTAGGATSSPAFSRFLPSRAW